MTYARRRNIVVRPDGRPVNVARSRGHLFVCASGCCCGRTEDGFAPVPAEAFHLEWERRRLRNVVHLTIGGYTDNTGNAAQNIKLSQDRADSVVNQLEQMNIAPDRLVAKGYGEDHPVGDNATAEGRALNRRISMLVTAK